MSSRKVPPLRLCPSCGGQHYAWSERLPCRSCLPDFRADSEAIGGLVRGNRKTDSDSKLPALPYNTFPEGF